MTLSPSSNNSNNIHNACQSPQPGDKICWNCKTVHSPLWRKFSPPTEGSFSTTTLSSTTYLCNKCGLFFKRNKKQRPLELDGLSNNNNNNSSSALHPDTSPTSNTSLINNSPSTPKKKRKVNKKTSSETCPDLVSIQPSIPTNHEEKKKRKRTTSNTITCYSTSGVASTSSAPPTTMVVPVSNTTSTTTTINSATTSSTTIDVNQFNNSINLLEQCISYQQPTKRRLVMSNENQQVNNIDYCFASNNDNTITTNNTNSTLGICSEDLDAIIIRESSKKNKNSSNNGAYLGFGSPIIQHSASFSTTGSNNHTCNNTLVNNNTNNHNVSHEEAFHLLQALCHQQMQANVASNVIQHQGCAMSANPTATNTPMHNHAIQQITTQPITQDCSLAYYPHHIMDWYEAENEPVCNHQNNSFFTHLNGNFSQQYDIPSSVSNNDDFDFNTLFGCGDDQFVNFDNEFL